MNPLHNLFYNMNQTEYTLTQILTDISQNKIIFCHQTSIVLSLDMSIMKSYNALDIRVVEMTIVLEYVTYAVHYCLVKHLQLVKR